MAKIFKYDPSTISPNVAWIRVPNDTYGRLVLFTSIENDDSSKHLFNTAADGYKKEKLVAVAETEDDYTITVENNILTEDAQRSILNATVANQREKASRQMAYYLNGGVSPGGATPPLNEVIQRLIPS